MEITFTLQVHGDISMGMQWKLLKIFVILWKKCNTEYTIIQRHNLLLDLMHISGAYVAIRSAMQMDGNGINIWEEF